MISTKSVLLFIYPVLIAYVLASLVLWEYNPAVWPFEARALTFLAGGSIGCVLAVHNETKRDNFP